jgi:hypothetical protein
MVVPELSTVNVILDSPPGVLYINDPVVDDPGAKVPRTEVHPDSVELGVNVQVSAIWVIFPV